MKSMVFALQKTLLHLFFHAESLNINQLLTSAKSRKSLSEKVKIFVRVWLFLKKKKIINLRKICGNCVNVNNFTVFFRFMKQEIVQCVLNAFYTKTRQKQDLLLDMELLKKMFPTMLDMINANRLQKFFFQSTTKDRMTHFNIFVALKHHRDEQK